MHWVIGAMPHPHQPDPTVRKSAITRTCPACGRDQMRLTLARPSIHFANLNECVYRCDCGEEAEYVMMRPEPE
jgi:C4-type Zn-finger protein